MSVAPVAASADGADFQFSKLYNSHTVAPVTGAYVGVARSGQADTFFFHATNMVPGPVVADVFVYNNPSACSGVWATPGLPGRCGGPNPATVIPGPGGGPVCVVLAAKHYDSCNPATGFQAFTGLAAGTANSAGTDNYYVRITPTNPAGAELELYLKTLNQPYLSGTATKYPKALAFFAAPTDNDTSHPDGHGNPEARDRD